MQDKDGAYYFPQPRAKEECSSGHTRSGYLFGSIGDLN